MTEKTLNILQEDALALLRSAANISRTRQESDKAQLVMALDENFRLWTAIQTVAGKDSLLARDTRENLLKLADFVVARTISEGASATERTLDTLENMNLQIAEGLLEGMAGAA